MHICIDSSVFVRGIQTNDATVAGIFGLLDGGVTLSIPRLVVKEVTRNLIDIQHLRLFYRIFHHSDAARIIDEAVPQTLLHKYIVLGLRAKGDAFQVLDPLNFLSRWHDGTL